MKGKPRGMAIVEKGQLQPTPEYYKDGRASAMKGQIERALVELITNSDDSYGDLEDAGQRAWGDIRIEITRRRKAPTRVVVKDRAEGMSAEEMKACLTRPGQRTSGFHGGRRRRGLHGRGAKDVSYFGATTFECIKDGRYSVCTMDPSTLDYEIKSGSATGSDRARLGILRGSGTVVTIEVARTFNVPSHQVLAGRFERHFALHDIFTSDRRKCALIDIEPSTGTERAVKPLQFHEPSGDVVAEEKLEFRSFPPLADADGNKVSPCATVVVKAHPEAFTEEKYGPNAPYRWSGLLIKSGVAIHDKTLFAYENEPYAQSLFGEVECAYIDELLRAFDGHVGDELRPTWNNIRLLDPDRDGFVKEHLFISALYSECECIIRRIVEQRKAEDTAKERVIRNRRLEKWLNTAMQKASRLFDDKLRETGDIPPIGPERAWKMGVTIVPPGEHRLAVGDRKVFSVVVNFGSPMPQGAAVAVRSDKPRAVRVMGSTAALRQDSADPNIGRCTFAVQAVSAGAQSFVSVATNGYQDVVLIETLDPSEIDPVEVPEGLSFDRRDYRVGHNKSKTLVLRYAGPVPTQELIASVASDHAGIQVRRPSCTLTPVGQGAFYEGRLSVTGRGLGARATVRASIGDHLRAEARVMVAEEKGGTGLRTPRLVDKEFGVMRVKWSTEDSALLEVACRHPAMAPYLGRPDADGRFPGEEREGFRAALAEAISEALAWRVIERRYQDPGLRADMTPTTYYTEYGSLMRDFLAIFHRGVAEDSGAGVTSTERLPADP